MQNRLLVIYVGELQKYWIRETALKSDKVWLVLLAARGVIDVDIQKRFN